MLEAGNRVAMRAAGRVVYLQVEPAEQLRRLAGDTGRPLAGRRPRPRATPWRNCRPCANRCIAKPPTSFETGTLPRRRRRSAGGVACQTTTQAHERIAPGRGRRRRAIPDRHRPGLLDDGAWLAAPARPACAGRQRFAGGAAACATRAGGTRSGLTRCKARVCMCSMPARHQEDAGEFSGVIDALARSAPPATPASTHWRRRGRRPGCAAACWMRGSIACSRRPALLAMVDSVGKTAVDIAQGKNLVGAFHPPRGDRRYREPGARCRRANCARLRRGDQSTARSSMHLSSTGWRRMPMACWPATTPCWPRRIARSCRHKGRDHRTRSVRMAASAPCSTSGHTFGHAIETEQGYGGLNHGEAVAVGMVLAARLSTALAWPMPPMAHACAACCDCF